MALKQMKIEVNNAVFSLPYHVAKEEGFYEEEGLDVELIRAGSGRNRDKEVPQVPIEDHTQVPFYGWHEGIEKGEFAMYRACEWGQIRRTQDSCQDVRVLSKRSSVATQAIVVRPDSPYQIPMDLKDKLVAVNMHAGSHYISLSMLGGYLGKEHTRVGHVGGPKQRLKFLEDGKVDAIAIMEPWITVSTKLGYRIISEAFYDGAEVADPSVDSDLFDAVNRALNKAVTKLNTGDGVKPYLKYMISEVPKDICMLTEEDFYLPRFRYLQVPRYYTPEEYGQIQDWMVDWGLLEVDSVYDKIIEGRKTA